jgi:aminoglycoside 3-N-acetyltransferase
MHSVNKLTADLQRLGVKAGGLLVVHSGYRSIGGVEGGPAGVVAALRSAVGDEGTVMAPAFTTDLIDPSTWPVPPGREERARILADMPYYDPHVSVPFKMGAVPVALWRTSGTLRSAHPVTSWAVLGGRAEELTVDHPFEDPEGVDGPVGRAWRADAQVLLLGCGHDANTTIHLAESLLDMPHLRTLPDRCPVRAESGEREWRPVTKTTKCSDGFTKIEPHLERAGVIRRGQVGSAEAQLLRSRDIVRGATELLAREPAALLCDDPECVHCPTSREALRTWRPVDGWRHLIEQHVL